MSRALRSPGMFVVAALLAAGTAPVSARFAHAQAEPAQAQPAPAVVPAPSPTSVDAAPAEPVHADSAPADSAPAAPAVQILGSGDQRIQVVDHDGSWSMHAENVMAETIFELWHEVGGPVVERKTPLDFPFTLSVHLETTERIVARILDGYGYTLHFNEQGLLELVRSYSPKPGRIFKTPRLVQSQGTWRQVESGKATLPGGAAEQGASAPVVMPAPPPSPATSRMQPVHEPVGKADGAEAGEEE